MKPGPLLTVEHDAKKLTFNLITFEDGPQPALHSVPAQPVNTRQLNLLVAGADRLLRKDAHDGFEDDARKEGNKLFYALIPQELADSLRRLEGSLRIQTRLSSVPWELMHDGTEFWGLRYALGKQHVENIRHAPPVPVRREAPRALIIASNPHDDLDAVDEEAERLEDELKGSCQVHTLLREQASFDNVTGCLRERFDIIHYAGHVRCAKDGPGIELANKEVLEANTIRMIFRGREGAGTPVVFINGCTSTRGSAKAGARHWNATIDSIAGAFLHGGAAGVVGTSSDVHDKHAAPLAARFYREFLKGRAVGEALRIARCSARESFGSSPTWLSVTLFGDPTLVLVDNDGATGGSDDKTDKGKVEPKVNQDEIDNDDRVPGNLIIEPCPPSKVRASLFALTGLLDPLRVDVAVNNVLHWALADALALGVKTVGPVHLAIAVLSSEEAAHVVALEGTSSPERRQALYRELQGKRLPPTQAAEVHRRNFSESGREVLAQAAAALPDDHAKLDLQHLVSALRAAEAVKAERRLAAMLDSAAQAWRCGAGPTAR